MNQKILKAIGIAVLASSPAALAVDSHEAFAKDQARAGAQIIDSRYNDHINSVSSGGNFDELLAVEMCGFTVLTEWGARYLEIIKTTPNLDVSDVQPVSALVTRLETIKDAFDEAKAIFPEQFNQFRSTISSMRSSGEFPAEANSQGLSLADVKADNLSASLNKCRDGAFLGRAVYRTEAGYWDAPVEYTLVKPGSISVSWGITGGYASYVVPVGEYATTQSKRSSFLKRALRL